MKFNEKNLMSILSECDKPMNMVPAFVIIDEYESKILNSMKCNHLGKEGQSSTATMIEQRIKGDK